MCDKQLTPARRSMNIQIKKGKYPFPFFNPSLKRIHWNYWEKYNKK